MSPETYLRRVWSIELNSTKYLFLYDSEREGSNFIQLHIFIQFFLTLFVKNIPFSSYALVPLEKLDVGMYVNLYMDS